MSFKRSNSSGGLREAALVVEQALKKKAAAAKHRSRRTIVGAAIVLGLLGVLVLRSQVGGGFRWEDSISTQELQVKGDGSTTAPKQEAAPSSGTATPGSSSTSSGVAAPGATTVLAMGGPASDAVLASASAAEIDQLLTPGSSGRGPFDLPRYPGFCRKMRPPNVPVLEVQRMWLTGKQRNSTDVSLVTQLSVDRLYMLEAQCSAWGSIISAAVHVALVGGKVVSELDELYGEDLSAPLELINSFHERVERRGRCKLDLVLLMEEVGSLELVGLYPVNALRNKALMLSQTEIVLLLDADFLPNRGLTDLIHQPTMYEQLRRVTGFRQGIVLPAFETIDDGDEGKSTARKAISGRSVLRELFNRGELRGFHMDHYNRGHRATDHTRWFETNISYRIPYEEGFEPYVLVQRRFVPWYDERFKGYRKNKVVHLMHMFRLGIEFVSTPHGYVVHSPHPVANSWNTTQATGFWYKLKKLYADSREDMANSIFVPATSFNCESKEPEKWSFYGGVARRLRRMLWGC